MIGKKSGTKTFQHYSPKVPPMEISPADDAFHGSPKRLAAEWWYFDANFPNNYSFHLGCRTFSKKNRGMVTPILNFYKDGKLIAEASGRYLFKKFQTSSVFPLVKLSNKTIIKFDEERFNDKGEWIYYISVNLDELEANLTFIGTSKGFKYETDAESWTVALPKASVTGDITINGKKMKVNGIGYHDHNWNYSLLTPLTYGRGWYWGKIMSKTLTISWAEVIKSSSRAELLAVVNQDNNGFFPTDVKNIHFEPDKFVYNHRKKMPTSFTFKIDDVVNSIPIKVDVKMKVQEVHYYKLLRLVSYWRYHVKTNGYISLGSHKEVVNRTQIMEYLKFG